MEVKRYHEFLEKILNLNLTIEHNIFDFTKFHDKAIEDEFQNDNMQKEKFQRFLGNVILLCGYFASFIYIFQAFYKPLFNYICTTCFLLTFILIILSYFVKCQKKRYIIDVLQIFLIGSSLNFKGNLLNFLYNSPEDDNYAELLRVIIYDFVSSNLFSLLKLPGNLYTSIGFFTFNFILVINSQIKSNTNHFYYLEGFTNFLFTFIFFFFRKTWDHRLRVNFAEAYKFERLYKYTTNFIIGLNANHLNIQGNNINYCDTKLQNDLRFFSEIYKDFNKEIIKSNKEGENDIENYINEINNNDNDNVNINEKGKEENLMEKDKKLFDSINTKENTNYTNNNNTDYDKTYNNSNNLNESEKENFSNEFNFLKKLYICVDKYSDDFNNNNNNSLKEDESLFDHLEKIRNTEFVYNTNDNNNNIRFYNFSSCINNSNNKDKNNEENKMKIPSNIFINLGIYYIKYPEIGKYYEVFIRKFQIKGFDYVYDILLYNVSELMLSKKINYETNIIKQKVLAKIAHEFKTPINSIIGLTIDLKDEFENDVKENTNNLLSINFNEKFIKTLDVIQNLSKYIIFLVSDIIQYSSLKDIDQVKLSEIDINVEEMAIFSHEILRCLLKCNIMKFRNIETELKYDKNLNQIKLTVDEIRLKQIILNLISNSVKFTKTGKIVIDFKLDINKTMVIIIIKDTGIGIKESDRKKLFNDFVMLDDGVNLNSQGSGLGLSICKSIANKMKIDFYFESQYGEGSTFLILVPIKSNLSPDDISNSPRIYKDDYFKNLIKNASFDDIIVKKINKIYYK
jgi:signal transduction histidine kinase